MTQNKMWIPMELEQLSTLVAEGNTIKQIAITMNRPYKSVKSKKELLHLHAARSWTAEEEQQLAELLKTHVRADVAEILGRSVLSVENKMGELKLYAIIKEPNNPDFFRADEDIFIKDHFQTMSNEEIALNLQRSTNAIGHRLARLNLIRDNVEYLRKQIKHPYKSADLAWFIGAVASDGWVDPDGVIAIDVADIEFRDLFAKKGVELFSIIPSFPESRIRGDDKELHRAIFCSREMVDFLGNLRKDSWAETFNERFSWILEDKQFISSFLSAYFDADGSVVNTWYVACAQENSNRLLKQMFDSLNIQSRFYFYKDRHAKIIIEDKLSFAKQIHLCINRKQAKLDQLLKEGC